MIDLSLVLSAALSFWWVDPYGDTPYLPDSPPQGGIVTNTLSCAAARGEIETISFSVKPERDLKKVNFIPSDLQGPGGAVIKASDADFALVKCWYRAGGRWSTSWSGDTSKPELINDLVIHDDDLIRVVESDKFEDRTILLRFDYDDGPVYVDMRKHGGNGDRFRHEVFPVKDPKKFVPFDLKKGRFQQYWFTWKIPEDAKPGLYKGRLDVREDGKPLCDIPVQIEVYPFVLPTARTHYDTSKPFISSWMGTPTLAGELANSKELAVAEEKCFNVYKSLAEHNAHQPNGPGVFEKNSTDDLSVRGLILMRRAGMNCDLLINGISFVPGWSTNPEAPFVPPEKDPELYKNVMKKYCAMLDVQAEVLDRYLGHRECYFSGPDECGTAMHQRNYGFITELNKRGFRAWADSGVAKDISWSIEMNDAPAQARHTDSWPWRRSASKCVSYAGTFTGPSCPDIWRRTKGLRHYYADSDGLHEYCFYYNRWNHWNDFTYRGSYTQMQIVYFTYDGLIPTLAWEGVREALDDIRYLSLLRLRCEAAMKSSDPQIRQLGKENFIWMDKQDPEAVIDLYAFRREVAARITRLIAAVGDEPPAKPLKPVPALPACKYGEGAPVSAAQAKEFAKNNRYDLSIPMWEKIRTDASRPAPDRAEAAIEEATQLSELLRREQAVAIIDDTLKLPSLASKERSRLSLLKVNVLMADKVYQEEFTSKQLDKAAKALKTALAIPGAPHKERMSAVLRILNAFRAGGHNEKACTYSDEFLKTMGNLGGQDKCELFIQQARAYADMKKWDESAKAFRLANDSGNCKKRDLLKLEGYVAEQRKDWKTALRCYTDEIRTYDRMEEGDLIAACTRKINRINKMIAETSGKNDFGIDDLDGPGIDLDE